MTTKNRKLIIRTCAGTFPKVQADRLPANVTGEELKTEFEKLFDEKGFLISNQRLGHLIEGTGKDSKVADILCALVSQFMAHLEKDRANLSAMGAW